MVIFTIFFNQVVGITSGPVPYPIFSFSGLILWNYFSQALTRASESLVSNQNIIKKSYFPRVIPPRVCDKFVGREINELRGSPKILPNEHSAGNI